MFTSTFIDSSVTVDYKSFIHRRSFVNSEYFKGILIKHNNRDEKFTPFYLLGVLINLLVGSCLRMENIYFHYKYQ